MQTSSVDRLLDNSFDGQEIVLRLMPMLADTVQERTISGGWIMSQLDQAGSVIPTRLSKRRVALVADDHLSFTSQVSIGDIVTFYASVQRIGHTSMTVKVKATTESQDGAPARAVTFCEMTYVALDADGSPVSIGSISPNE